MLNEDRYKLIFRILKEKNTATVGYLKKALYVSETTVRRDLLELERRGIVKRIWGGAMLAKCPDAPGFVRLNINREAKELIAKKAVSLIRDSSSLFIDSSSTCVYLAYELKKFSNLNVVTNSIDIIRIIKDFPGITAYLVGGIVTEGYDLTGKLALDGISQFYTDYAFLSCSGITADKGIMGNDPYRQAIQQAMIKNSDTPIVLCDTSKAGKKTLLSVASLDDVAYVVMETSPDSPELVRTLGKKLITASDSSPATYPLQAPPVSAT